MTMKKNTNVRFFGKEIVSNVTFVISHRVEKYNFHNFKKLNDKKT
jgi:hypothetical protein